jgi:hypothetical protein
MQHLERWGQKAEESTIRVTGEDPGVPVWLESLGKWGHTVFTDNSFMIASID